MRPKLRARWYGQDSLTKPRAHALEHLVHCSEAGEVLPKYVPIYMATELNSQCNCKQSQRIDDHFVFIPTLCVIVPIARIPRVSEMLEELVYPEALPL